MHSYHWLLLWGCLVGSPLLAAPPTCRSLDPLLYLAFVAEPLSPERFFNLEQTQGPPDVLRQRAAVLMSLGRWFDAATLVQALPADDLSADTALLAALLAFHQGAFAEAQEQFTAAERSYRQADQARPTLLAVGAWALNQRQYPRYPPSPGPATPAATVMTALVSAELALFHGDAAAAADHLDALSPTQQQSPMVLAMTARIALCRGDDPTPLLDALQRRDPNTVDEALWRGDWAWRQGNRVAARQFYDQARQRREEDGRVWLRLGLLDQYDGETRQALDKLHRALALNPAGVGYLGEMALLLTRLGRFRDAERDLHAHLAQFPTDAVALMALGYWHLRQGDDGAALGWLRQSLDADPHETRALSYAAIALYRLKQPDAALALLAQAHGDVQSRLTTDPLSWQVATRIQREQNQLLSGLHSAAQTVAAWEQRLPLEAWAMNAGLTDPGATAARWELTALAFAQSLATEQNPLLWATLGATRDFREQAQRLGRFRDPLTVGEDPLRDDILRRANALTTATVAVEGQAAAWGPRLGVSHRGLAAGETVAYAAEGAMTRFQDGGHRWQVGGEVGAVNLGRLSGFSGVQRQQLDLDDQTARQHQVFLGGQLDLSATQQLGVLAQQDLTIYEQRTAVTDYNSQQLWTLGLRQTNPGIQWGVSYQQLRQQRDASGADSRDQERQREQLWTGWLDGQRRDFLAGVTVQAGIAVQNIQRQDALTTADAEVVATRTVVQTESRLGPRLGVAWQATAADVLRLAYQDGYRTRADLQPLTLAGIPSDSRYVEPGGRTRRLALAWERQWQAALLTRLSFDYFNLDNAQQAGIKSAQAERLQDLRELFLASTLVWDDLEGEPRYDTGRLWRLESALDQGLSARWSWFLRYRYLSSRNTGGGLEEAELELPYVPRHAGALGLSWHGDGGLQLSARALYRSTRYRDEANLSPLDAGWDLALQSEWRAPRRDWVVRAVADHLLNPEAQSFYGLSVEYRY